MYVTMEYVLPVVFPFCMGLIVAMLLFPLRKWLERRLHVKRELAGFLALFTGICIVLLIAFGVGYLLFSCGSYAGRCGLPDLMLSRGRIIWDTCCDRLHDMTGRWVMEPEDYTREWEAARSFNDTITSNNLYGDVFGEEAGELQETEYWHILNAAGDGVMGYMSIPKINIKLAIYHGTGDDVLQTGIGHLNGTRLPIGGESTHSVLAAHRGLPSARLFTDVDQMVRGDRIYIRILDETLAYEVDQILPMVDKDDMETLQEALSIREGEDHITLFTCTPYGVNSHRLLVRGVRVPYNGEEEIASTPVDTMLRAVQNYYMLYLILGLSVTILVILIMRFLFRPRRS